MDLMAEESGATGNWVYVSRATANLSESMGGGVTTPVPASIIRKKLFENAHNKLSTAKIK